jgi:hypothetical protein
LTIGGVVVVVVVKEALRLRTDSFNEIFRTFPFTAYTIAEGNSSKIQSIQSAVIGSIALVFKLELGEAQLKDKKRST